MSASASSFLLPDADPTWRLWKSLSSGNTEALDTPAECKEGSKPVVVGLPATACRSVGLALPTTDKTLLASMIEAQLEKRGVPVQEGQSPSHAWHHLGVQDGYTLVSVDVLASPFPAELAVKHAANYTAALRMMHLPPGEFVILEEQGWLVLAVGYQGRLWHSHVLGAADAAGADLAREIEIAKLALESQDNVGAVRGILLVGSRLGALHGELRKHLSLPVETIPALQPGHHLKLETFPRLLPASVFEAQAAKKRRKNVLAGLGMMVMLYGALFTLGWWYLKRQEASHAALQARVAETSAPAAAVKATDQRWKSLLPAIDVNRYPMVQLSEISALMPPSGVQLKKFTAKTDEIELTGDARDAQTVTQFFEDLKSHPKLGNYTWSMPVPSVRDKVASFRIQGKLQ